MIFKFINWLRKRRFNMTLEKGLKNSKEGRVTSYHSVEEVWKKMDEWKKAHPVLSFFKELYYEIFHRIPNKIEDFFLDIKYFIQRGKRGYADCDIWGFDTYISKLIIAGTKEIKRIKHGIPMILFKKSELSQDGNMSDEVMKKADARYDAILDSIIWTFETYYRSHVEGYLLIPQGKKYYTELELIELEGFCYRMNEKSIVANERYEIISQEDFQKYLIGWRLFQTYFSALND